MISTKGHRVGGYGKWFNGDIGMPDIERDTAACKHCGGHFFVDPFQAASDAGGWCSNCAGVICPKCVSVGICEPFEKRLDRMEKAHR